MARTNLYRGFSSFEFQKNKSFRLTDIEIVKMDLLNHIFTRRGDRVNMPTFGTQIPDMVFEPLDEETIDIISDEIEGVIDYDPRVELLSLVVDPIYDENTVTVAARIRYIELNMDEVLELRLEFEGGL